ncbi:AMP-binding protein [Streptomyces qinzhouensis]|uniref:D-alanine--poly(Phosphoribitol) ligase n=1 Tax=Streptomyces qinzhouensis TaxID=2599401 RepID=A0A5B8IPZ5_9ACTN|nr:AMP-binding protein [Streptomyces qinzhouensis]QDY75206.1 D-alanine--poly(phosphoribitol) ligase [Streptomyces qinzhouensis]QDY80592.1 D-alanine--poly(phosphoribitol) ligase [Streptomyces qinzhouensis]
MNPFGPRPPRAHASVDNLRTYLLAGAATAPHRPAVIQAAPGGGLETLTYGELAERTDACAETLGALGLDVGDRVLIESDTSADAIAALLACATLGLPFVPVTPQLPDERLRAIIDGAEPALHLQAEGGRRTGIPAPVGTGRIGPAGLTIERPPAPRGPRRRRTVTPVDTAYIIFTSGTTGRPKGVAMSHRGVVSFLRGVRTYSILTPDDRVAGTAPLQFDFALFDIGFALSHGAALIPVPHDRLSWPRRFLAFLRETGATRINAVPSLWRPVLRHEPGMLAELGRSETVRGVLFSGEAFPPDELRRLQELLPTAQFLNLYGPTEVMAISLTRLPNPLPPDAVRLSIGSAVPGAEMTLIAADGRIVDEPGPVGEIHLRSTSLFSGYWNDPETTRTTLVPDPLDPASGRLVLKTGDLASLGPDGDLYFHGRADSQVQIRGNRVELGEVEGRVAAFPGITGAVAAVLAHDDDEPRLHAFVTHSTRASAPDPKDVAAFVRTVLPAYMVPHHLHVVDTFPLTPNGKVDRAALGALLPPRP